MERLQKVLLNSTRKFRGGVWMGVTTDEDIHVHCPNCSNKRLFDCGLSSEGIIKIKCPCCKAVSVINLQHVTERQRRKKLKAYQKVAISLHKDY